MVIGRARVGVSRIEGGRGLAEAVDEAEDERQGGETGRDELPEELKRREDWLAAIREAKTRLEAEQRTADGARGRKPGQARNPKGGRSPKQAGVWRAGREGAGRFHPSSVVSRKYLDIEVVIWYRFPHPPERGRDPCPGDVR